MTHSDHPPRVAGEGPVASPPARERPWPERLLGTRYLRRRRRRPASRPAPGGNLGMAGPDVYPCRRRPLLFRLPSPATLRFQFGWREFMTRASTPIDETTMSTQNSWLPVEVCQHNVALDRVLRSRFDMSLKTYKAIKVGVLSLATIALAVYAIANGAAPGITAWSALAVICILNGVELSEFLAVYADLSASAQDAAQAEGSTNDETNADDVDADTDDDKETTTNE